MTQVMKLPDGPFSLVMDRPMTPAEFLAFSQANPDLVMELEPNGKINIISPVNSKSGNLEGIIITYLGVWAIENGQGKHFSSSTGFTMPDDSIRSPDAAWVSDEQLANLGEGEMEGYASIVPNFVVEIRSKSDRLDELRRKMQNVWMAHGTRLGWLIDPHNEQVFVYRADGSVDVVKSFDGELSGEEVLPGFVFRLGVLLK